MNLKEIREAAQAYCDRYDEELVSAIPAFIKVVEAKINNALRTGDQSIRAQIYLERDQEYYGLPSDWGGARDVEILEEGQQHGPDPPSPEEMNKLSAVRTMGVTAQLLHHHSQQLQIAPP